MWRHRGPSVKFGTAGRLSREESLAAWKQIVVALANPTLRDERVLAKQIVKFVKDMPMLERAALCCKRRRSGQSTRDEPLWER